MSTIRILTSRKLRLSLPGRTSENFKDECPDYVTKGNNTIEEIDTNYTKCNMWGLAVKAKLITVLDEAKLLKEAEQGNLGFDNSHDAAKAIGKEIKSEVIPQSEATEEEEVESESEKAEARKAARKAKRKAKKATATEGE